MENSPITREQLLDIYEECGRDITKVAERLNLSQEEFKQLLTPEPARPMHRRQPPANLGRASLRKYIISVRHADNPCEWPKQDRDAIERARSLYEAGTHEMYQGRDGAWIIQYLQPRKVHTKPRKFYREIL